MISIGKDTKGTPYVGVLLEVGLEVKEIILGKGGISEVGTVKVLK